MLQDLLSGAVAFVTANPWTTFTTVVTAASVVCAGTATPDPNTTFGRIYKAVEILALNFGKAKHSGEPVPQDPPYHLGRR